MIYHLICNRKLVGKICSCPSSKSSDVLPMCARESALTLSCICCRIINKTKNKLHICEVNISDPSCIDGCSLVCVHHILHHDAY